MHRLFGSRRDCPAVLLTVLLATGVASAADEASLTLHNATPRAIDVYVASEKSRAEKPWAHLQIGGEEDGKCALESPDRYVVIVQTGQQRWRSKRMELKEFLAAHPGYLLRIGELESNAISGRLEPGPDAQTTAAEANDSAPPMPPQTLPLKFRKYELANQEVWSLAPHVHKLRLHNDMSEAVDVYIAPQNSQDADPWTHLNIEPRTDAVTILKAPDPFIIRIELANGSGRSRPIYLQEFLDEHPDYVMAVGRTYKGVVTGTPYSTGSAEGAASGAPSAGPSPKPSHLPPPVSVGPAQQKPEDSKTELPPTLNVEWERPER